MPLGRGLESLIRKKTIKPTEKKKQRAIDDERGVFFVEIVKIDPGAQQPRKDFVKSALADLAASIRQHGILQPLVVEKHEEETRRGVAIRYQLLAGERRLRAAKLAGLRQVPVVIRQASDDRVRLLLSLIENVQREDLNAMERAEAYARLRDEFGLSQEEVGQRVSKSREAVANTLRLLQLDDEMKKAIRRGEISEGHARALLSVEGQKRQKLFSAFKENPMSVREAEAMAREASQGSRAPTRVADPRRARDEANLQKTLGVPVRITTRGTRGSIALLFRSKEELRNLLRKLTGK